MASRRVGRHRDGPKITLPRPRGAYFARDGWGAKIPFFGTFSAIWGQKLDPRQDFFYFFGKKKWKKRDFYEKVGQIWWVWHLIGGVGSEKKWHDSEDPLPKHGQLSHHGAWRFCNITHGKNYTFCHFVSTLKTLRKSKLIENNMAAMSHVGPVTSVVVL